MQALLLAGGKGTRLWPLSKADTPKQILSPLNNMESLLEMTTTRIKNLGFIPDNIHLVTSEKQTPLMKPFWKDASTIIAEPSAQNTGPAILLATKKLMEQGCDPTESIYIFPTDHVLTNFQPNLNLELDSMILCYRIVPTRAETNYGYINTHTGGVIRKVRSFQEKPPKETAELWYQDWVNGSEKGEEEKFFWNSGIYALTLNSLACALERIDKELLSLWHDSSYKKFREQYATLPKLPFDKMIAEKAYNLHSAPLPADSWRDIGTWQSVYEALSHKPRQNIHTGTGTMIISNSKSCLISSDKEFNITCAGVEDLGIIIKDNNILIINKKDPEAMTELIREIQNNHPDLLV